MKLSILFLVILLGFYGCKDKITDMTESNSLWELNSKINVSDIQLCNNGYIVAINNGNIYRTKNNGQSWERLGGISGMKTLCAGPDDELISQSDVMLVSVDYGLGWKGVNLYPYDDNTAMNMPQAWCSTLGPDNNFYLGTSWGVFYSSDRGSSWKRNINDLQGKSMVSILAASDGTLYSGTYSFDNNPELYISRDKSKTWTKADISNQTINTLAEDSAGNIYAGGLFKLFKSTDKGVTWTSSAAPGTKFLDIKCDRYNIYAAFEDGGVFISSDGGNTWKDYNLGLGSSAWVANICFDRNGYLYAATWRNGIFKSKKPLYNTIIN